jgi:t-SNARE complex subunit (syntaxin)
VKVVVLSYICMHKFVFTLISQVFKDLADIVNDQQRDIDAVESMIEKSHQHAQSGLSHVQKVITFMLYYRKYNLSRSSFMTIVV